MQTYKEDTKMNEFIGAVLVIVVVGFIGYKLFPKMKAMVDKIRNK